jgi:hypothetical protein
MPPGVEVPRVVDHHGCVHDVSYNNGVNHGVPVDVWVGGRSWRLSRLGRATGLAQWDIGDDGRTAGRCGAGLGCRDRRRGGGCWCRSSSGGSRGGRGSSTDSSGGGRDSTGSAGSSEDKSRVDRGVRDRQVLALVGWAGELFVSARRIDRLAILGPCLTGGSADGRGLFPTCVVLLPALILSLYRVSRLFLGFKDSFATYSPASRRISV